jgi:hypothetical protein
MFSLNMEVPYFFKDDVDNESLGLNIMKIDESSNVAIEVLVKRFLNKLFKAVQNINIHNHL